MEANSTLVNTAASSHGTNESESIAVLFGAFVGILVLCAMLFASILIIYYIYKEEARDPTLYMEDLEKQEPPEPVETVPDRRPTVSPYGALPFFALDLNGLKYDCLINYKEIDAIPQPISESTFGYVYKGEWKGKYVAMKTTKPNISDEAKQDFLLEVEITMSLKPHENWVKVLGMCKEPIWAIITEYYPLGSLKDLLDNPKIEFTLEKSISISRDIAKGMIFLHSQRIVHRDLAARNVLVAEENGKWVAKICDLGMSRRIVDPNIAQLTLKDHGPLKWMAPECFRQEYSLRSDIWSYGITVWYTCIYNRLTIREILSRQDPYPDSCGSSSTKRPCPPETAPLLLRNLILACCEMEPSDRISFEQAINDYLDKVEYV